MVGIGIGIGKGSVWGLLVALSLAAAVSDIGGNSGMGSVPYFRDDAGSNTQMAGDYLYGYWDRRLCRYDPETMEETVLYEAPSPQHGDFCIWGDYIYFMVIPNVTVVESLYGFLYRVKCDGSEEAVCLTSVEMPGQAYGGQYYEYYKLDTYDDVLYLTGQFVRDDNDNLYFRLGRDGSITRIPKSGTLYGKLPAGYSLSWGYPANKQITLTYAMRNYGYVFVEDAAGNLVRFDPDSQQTKWLRAWGEGSVRDITNDAVIFCEKEVWYRAFLDNIQEIEEIGEVPRDYSYVSWDRDGLYFLAEKDNSAYLLFVSWEGERTYLQGIRRSPESPVGYFGGEYYYYVTVAEGRKVVRRFDLTEDAAPEQVTVYSNAPSWGISTRETYDYDWKDDYTGAKVDFVITEVHFTGDAGASVKINDFLDGLYAQEMESMEFYKKAVNRESNEQWEEFVEYSNVYEVCYVDEDYAGVAAHWYEYWKGAAHGMHGTDYYMFDRHTGERVFITDVVDNSAGEICEIMAPYVEAAASWGTGDEGWEAILLQEDRFFLSEEGIGIHFDVYEVNGYANGDQEIIVPYSVFD